MSKRFDSRRGYEAAMVHVVNGIMRERLGSRQEVAEARAARHPHLVSRVVQDGVE
jgi:hypothetical protein